MPATSAKTNYTLGSSSGHLTMLLKMQESFFCWSITYILYKRLHLTRIKFTLTKFFGLASYRRLGSYCLVYWEVTKFRLQLPPICQTWSQVEMFSLSWKKNTTQRVKGWMRPAMRKQLGKTTRLCISARHMFFYLPVFVGEDYERIQIIKSKLYIFST